MALNITINRQLRVFEATNGQAVRARLAWEEAERRGLRVSWSTEILHFNRLSNIPVPARVEGETYPMDDRFAEIGQVKAVEKEIPWADALELRLVASGEEAQEALTVVAFSSGAAEYLVRAEE
jgi:hypothetical protein